MSQGSLLTKTEDDPALKTPAAAGDGTVRVQPSLATTAPTDAEDARTAARAGYGFHSNPITCSFGLVFVGKTQMRTDFGWTETADFFDAGEELDCGRHLGETEIFDFDPGEINFGGFGKRSELGLGYDALSPFGDIETISEYSQ